MSRDRNQWSPKVNQLPLKPSKTTSRLLCRQLQFMFSFCLIRSLAVTFIVTLLYCLFIKPWSPPTKHNLPYILLPGVFIRYSMARNSVARKPVMAGCLYNVHSTPQLQCVLYSTPLSFTHIDMIRPLLPVTLEQSSLPSAGLDGFIWLIRSHDIGKTQTCLHDIQPPPHTITCFNL